MHGSPSTGGSASPVEAVSGGADSGLPVGSVDAEPDGSAGAEVAGSVELVEEDDKHLANPYIAAERGYIDAVIAPHETRAEVVRALRLLRTKRETLPPKKHGNIPL